MKNPAQNEEKQKYLPVPKVRETALLGEIAEVMAATDSHVSRLFRKQVSLWGGLRLWT